MQWLILWLEMVYFFNGCLLLWDVMLNGVVILLVSRSIMCRINKDLVSHCAFSSLPDWVVTSIGVVHELLQVRWNCMCLQLLNSHELDFIIDAVCTG